MATPSALPFSVAVVGAGPVGASTAAALARAHPTASVTLFERRPAPRYDSAAPSPVPTRNYGIVLSRRGLRALEDMGAPFMESELLAPIAGTVFHPKEGAPKVLEGTLAKAGRAVAREHLSRLTLEWAESEGVALRYSTALEQIKRDRQEVVVVAEDGTKETFKYDLLVGADGVGSTVRQELQRLRAIAAKVIPEPVPYKTCALPPFWAFTGNEGVTSVATWDNRVHIWQRSTSSLLFPPTFPQTSATDTSKTSGPDAVLILHPGTDLTQLQSPHGVASYFNQWYPDLVRAFSRLDDRFPSATPHFHAFAQHLASDTTYYEGRATFCSRLATRRVALVGDAAHSMAPALGQGANCGLEGAAALVRVLREASWEVPEALERYDGLRRREGAAAVTMSRWASPYSKARRTQFFTAFATHKLFRKVVPFMFEGTVEFADLGRSDVPYSVMSSTLFTAVRLTWAIAAVLCLGILAIVMPYARGLVVFR